MKPLDHYTNGDAGSAVPASPSLQSARVSAESGGSESSEGEADAEAEELSLEDAGAPARALNALNALRKSRQHYDVLLVAGGEEVPAHRAVLAAASPYLLEALADAPAAPYRVPNVDAEALRALVEYAYSGRLVVPSVEGARRLYLAAWRLRVEPARRHLAERLLHRLRPASCLPLRALPGLEPAQLHALDSYIADNFEEVCSCGALGTLPQLRVEVLRESSAARGAEEPLAVADAVLAWLLDQPPSADLTELCSRGHLVFVDARGTLRDCGELPSSPGDAPELSAYRADAVVRRRAAPPTTTATASTPRSLPALQLGARSPDAGSGVLAARRAGGGGTRALLALRGTLLALSAGWAPGGAGGAQAGGTLAGGARPATLAGGRCALGAAALGQVLLACGGYDRARVLRSAETYDPALDAWRPAPDMRRERARFPVAVLHDTMYAFGGSDGHAELDSVEAYSAAKGWGGRARLPVALSHAAAAADPRGGVLYVAGGWAGGAYVRRAWRYDPAVDAWSDAPPMTAARAQAAAACWEGALWVLGGCDAWHCLSSTERLPLDGGEAGWQPAPALPTARRSQGACAWRGRLVCAGGSDGAASLRRTDWLEPGAGGAGVEVEWHAGPPLRRARAAAGLAVLHDTLYAVGGFDGKEFLACAECLSSPDGEWTALRSASRPGAPLSASEPSPGRRPADGAVRASDETRKDANGPINSEATTRGDSSELTEEATEKPTAEDSTVKEAVSAQ